MITTTTQTITGKDFEEIMVVSGSCCVCKYEKEYWSDFNDDLLKARRCCFEIMQENASKYHADAIIDVKYEIRDMINAIVLLVYGTAVKFIDAYVVSKK